MTDHPSTPPANAGKRPYVALEDEMEDMGPGTDDSGLSAEAVKAILASDIQLRMVCEEFINQNDIRSIELGLQTNRNEVYAVAKGMTLELALVSDIDTLLHQYASTQPPSWDRFIPMPRQTVARHLFSEVFP